MRYRPNRPKGRKRRLSGPEELVNRQFEHWKVLQFLGYKQDDGTFDSTPASRGMFYLCECTCKRRKAVQRYELLDGEAKGCKICVYKDRVDAVGADPNPLEPGTEYKDWEVVALLGHKQKDGSFGPYKDKQHSSLYYLCRCKCGNEAELPKKDLTHPTKKQKCLQCLYPNSSAFVAGVLVEIIEGQEMAGWKIEKMLGWKLPDGTFTHEKPSDQSSDKQLFECQRLSNGQRKIRTRETILESVRYLYRTGKLTAHASR